MGNAVIADDARGTVDGPVPTSPIKAVIRLLAELVLDVHRPGADGVCVGCIVTSGRAQPVPCGPARLAEDALEAVNGG